MRYKSIGNAESIPNNEEIWNTVEKLSKKYHIQTLCHIFQVSESGYYAHKKLIEKKSTQRDREQEDVQILQELCKTRKKGYRSVTMQVKIEGKVMNHKKILRLMKKHNFLAKVRRRNPYKQILKAGEEHTTKKNILRRNFKGDTPLQKLGTDITGCKTFQELVKYIENYIFEYNNNRPQWNKKKMTPVEYRNHLLTNKN